MLSSCRILVSPAVRAARKVLHAAKRLALSASCGLGLAACGQQGPLYLPTEPAAANRATLLQTLLPRSGPASAPAPQTPAASPAVLPAQSAPTPTSTSPSR